METVPVDAFSLAVTILICYHFLFFWKQYSEPFKQSTSEVISTFFPHWIWMGRSLRRGKFPMKDKIYYQYPGCIPFLSTFYPLNLVCSLASSYFRLDTSFVLFGWLHHLHYLLGSILSYLLFSQWASPPVALFGSITLTYAAFMIKIQPCVVYTVNWLPGTLLPGPLGGLSVMGSILGGYWPYCVYFLPVSFMAQYLWFGNVWWFLGGLLFSLPQIIPFLWYLPQSVRAKKTGNPGKFGTVPISRIITSLIRPDNYTTQVNGLLSQESALYIGLIPLYFAFKSPSLAMVPLTLSFLGMMGLIPNIGRIAARWGHLFTFSLVWLAVDGLARSLTYPWVALWAILLLQAFMLLKNNQQISYWPFTEWWKRPSEFWGRHTLGLPYNSKFPYFTGYMTETITPGYTGGFALQRMHDKYGIKDPNGERVTSWTQAN